MALMVCLDCSAAFAVGLSRCPQCGSERHAEEGSARALGIVPGVELEEPMPKITRHGGPTNAAAAEHTDPPAAAAAPTEEVAPDPEATSEAPVEKPAPRKKAAARRKPARAAAPEDDTE